MSIVGKLITIINIEMRFKNSEGQVFVAFGWTFFTPAPSYSNFLSTFLAVCPAN